MRGQQTSGGQCCLQRGEYEQSAATHLWQNTDQVLEESLKLYFTHAYICRVEKCHKDRKHVWETKLRRKRSNFGMNSCVKYQFNFVALISLLWFVWFGTLGSEFYFIHFQIFSWKFRHFCTMKNYFWIKLCWNLHFGGSNTLDKKGFVGIIPLRMLESRI